MDRNLIGQALKEYVERLSNLVNSNHCETSEDQQKNIEVASEYPIDEQKTELKKERM